MSQRLSRAKKYAEIAEIDAILLVETPKGSLLYAMIALRVNWFLFLSKFFLSMPEIKTLWRPIFKNLSRYEDVHSSEAIIIYKKGPGKLKEFNRGNFKWEAMPMYFKHCLLIDFWFVRLFFYWKTVNKNCK